MVRLICPHCESDLEIDDAFRGSVCRCYTCGSLLSVPGSKGEAGPADDRPDAPPTADEDVEGAYAVSPPPPDAPADAAESDAGAAAAQAAATTPKRRATQPKPRRPKRSARLGREQGPSRMATVLAMVVTVVVLIGVLYVAVNMFGPVVEQTPQEITAEVLGDHSNPYTDGGAQFLSAGLAGRTAIIIDSSDAMRGDFGRVGDAAAVAVAGAEDGQVLQIIVARETDPVIYPEEPAAAGELSVDDLNGLLDTVTTRGGLALGDALERAIEGEPERVIIVARYWPMADEVAEIIEMAEEAGIELTAIVIEAEEATAMQLIEDAGGEVIRIPATRLRQWHEAWRAGR